MLQQTGHEHRASSTTNRVLAASLRVSDEAHSPTSPHHTRLPLRRAAMRLRSGTKSAGHDSVRKDHTSFELLEAVMYLVVRKFTT